MAEKSLKDLSAGVFRIAENSPKIQHDVEEIRKAICGSGGMLEILVNHMKPSGEKSSIFGRNRASGPVIDTKFVKKLTVNTDKIYAVLGCILNEVRRMGTDKSGHRMNTGGLDGSNFRSITIVQGPGKLDNVMKSIGIINALKSFNLKDLVLAKTKLKHIGSIMSRALGMFRMFKDTKEMEGTISFINSSTELVKKLAKISIFSKPAKWGVKAIESIMFGSDGESGLSKVFLWFKKNKKDIDGAKKSAVNVVAFCGSMTLVSIALTGVAILGPTALLGAVITAGIVKILTGVFSTLGKATMSMKKGSIALAILGGGIISFSIGFMLLRKTVEGLTLAEVGIMAAAIGGTALAFAGIGLLSAPIALGSASVLLLGASLGVLALSLMAWENLDTKKSMGNIELAIEGLRDVFGLELGKGDETKTVGQRFSGGLMDIAMGVLNFGKTFFVMGSLLLAGAALGMLKVGLSAWDDFDGKKASENIRTAIGSLTDVFGLQNRENESVKGKLSGLGGDILALGSSLLQFGSTFVKMGTLVIATAMMDVIRLTLIPWNEYDGIQASENIGKAISALETTFGLKPEGEEPTGLKGFAAKLGKIGNGILNVGSTLAEGGAMFAKLASLSLALGTMDLIRLELIPWNKYDGIKALGNIKKCMTGISTVMLTGKNTISKKDMDNFVDIGKKFETGVGHVRKSLRGITKMNEILEFAKTGSGYLKSTVRSVNELDINKSEKLVEVFKSFSNIRPNSALKKLIDAINRLADACGVLRESTSNTGNGQTESTSGSAPVSQTSYAGNISISNVQQLADAIAQALGGIDVNLDPSMLDVNLLVEGCSGKSVRVSIED